MTSLRPIIGLGLALLWIAAAPAADLGALRAGESGVVAGVIDADTVRLQNAAVDVRLIGLQGPKLPLGRKGFKAWPLAEEARAALAGLVQDRAVTLRLGTTATDRNGRTLAHVVRDDGLWIQGEMLRLGWARVYTFPDNRLLAADMLALEAEARAAPRGIWAHAFYAVRDAANAEALSKDTGSFQIVRGTVRAAARTKDRTFLNFGDDYRTDFTASVSRRDEARFRDLGIDLVEFENQTVEVRGWIESRNGPSIDVTHPEQIVKIAP
ncbi:MAG: thermonuclease family protein [Rhodospirillaceae bacterium]|nr:thermonuclease family protein [Rhodospirillaceae bacterium]